MPQRQLLQLVSWSGALMRWVRSWLIALAILAMAGAPAQAQPIASWNSLGPPGGTVLSLLQSPSAPSTIFAGTSQNGVFVSFDSGQTWSAANAGIASTPTFSRRTVRSLVSDGQYLYAATDVGIFYATLPIQATDLLTWTAMASTNAASAITLLAVDTASGTLFAAGAGPTPADPPVVYSMVIPLPGTPGANWTVSALPADAAGNPVTALAVVPGVALPGGGSTQATVLVGALSRVFGASVPLGGATWYDADNSPSPVLAGQGVIETLAYSTDFSRAYACSGGQLFQAQATNPFDPSTNTWLALRPMAASVALTCSSIATGMGLAAVATDVGVYTSTDGTNFIATKPLPVSGKANAVLVSAGPSGAPTLFAGGGFGLSVQAVATLSAVSAWANSNGANTVAAGGSNNRLNSSSVSDVAVLGTTLYAAVTDEQYADVLLSTDGGATWTSTGLSTALSGSMVSIPALAVDATNGVVYAGTELGLYALKGGSWVAVSPANINANNGVVTIARDAGILYVGTDQGLFSLKLGPTPASIGAVAAGLATVRVTALHVKGGKIYAGTNDTNSSISAVSEADSVATGLPVWHDFITGPNIDVKTPVDTLGRSISSFAVAGKWLLAAVRGKGVFIAEHDGAWTDASAGLPTPNSFVLSLISDGSNVYAATRSDGVFAASLNGADAVWAPTWASFNGPADHALPSLEVHQFRSDGTVLYAATAAGLATFDGIAPIVEAPVPASQVSSDSGGGGIDAWALLGLALMLVAVAATAHSGRRSE